MKKLGALTLILVGIGANILACGCQARRTAPQRTVTTQNQ